MCQLLMFPAAADGFEECHHIGEAGPFCLD
jgi:hypothetical protein